MKVIIALVVLLSSSMLYAQTPNFDELVFAAESSREGHVVLAGNPVKIPSFTYSESTQLYRWLVRVEKDIEMLRQAVQRERRLLAARHQEPTVFSDIFVHDRSFVNEWRLQDFYQASFKSHRLVLAPLLKRLDVATGGLIVNEKRKKYSTLIEYISFLTGDIETDAGTAQWEQLGNALNKLDGEKPYRLTRARAYTATIRASLTSSFPGLRAIEAEEGGLKTLLATSQDVSSSNAYVWLLRARRDVRRLLNLARSEKESDFRMAENEIIRHDRSWNNEWTCQDYVKVEIKALAQALDHHMQAFDRQSGERRYREVLSRLRSLSGDLETDLGDPTQKEQDKAFDELIERADAAVAAIEQAISRRRTQTPAAAAIEGSYGMRRSD